MTPHLVRRARLRRSSSRRLILPPNGRERCAGRRSLTTRQLSRGCEVRSCPNTPARMIPRDINEDTRDVARALAGTNAFEQSRRDRKRVEMLFAHLKRIFKLSRLRLRGPCGAQDEFTLAAIAQNLCRLAKLVARAPPLAATCVA